MFDENQIPKIIQKLKDESPKAKEVGEHLRQIKCRHCGENEAFTWLEKPWKVICPRTENCGISSTTKELFPEFWENFSQRFADDKNPEAIAEAYLRSRGLDPSKIDFIQDQHTIDGIPYYTVSLSVEGMQQKYPYRVLIDAPSGDNKRWQGGESHSGLVYQPDPNKPFDKTQPIYITESPIDALSLRQAGFQVVSVFSSAEVPKEFYSTLAKDQLIRLAFDNDYSGHQGVIRNYNFLKNDLGFHAFTNLGANLENIEAFLPPAKFKDWNEMLQHNGGVLSFSEKQEKECLSLGKRILAPNALKCFKEICSHEVKGSNTHFVKTFDFRDGIYKGVQNNKGEHSVTELADKAIRFKFREVDEEGRHSYHLEVGRNRGRQKAKTVELRAEDLLTNRFAEIMVSKTESIVTQSRTDLQSLYKHLLGDGNIETIMSTGLYGHDPVSDWFVFGSAAFDSKGRLYRPVAGTNYFKADNGKFIRPFDGIYADKSEPITGVGEKTELKEFIEQVDIAYGARGLLVMGYFVAGLFSTHIFNRYRVFPFLSVVGEGNVGKTTLMHLMSRAFCFSDREGVALNETNTKKGVSRVIAAHSSLTLALTEWTNDRDFSESSLKNMFGRGSIQTRAAFSNDNRIITLPLRCALAFVWNKELFKQKPVIQRTVTVRFHKDMLDDTTKAMSNTLMAKEAKDIATVGEQVLQNRIFYQESLIDQIEHEVSLLSDENIDDQRIGRNHAFPLAALHLLTEHAEFSERKQKHLMERVRKVALKSAEAKLYRAANRLPNADLCLQVVREAAGEEGVDWVRVEPCKGIRKESEGPEMYFHLPSFLEHHQNKITKVLLVDELNKHDDFICRAKVRLPMSPKPLEVWVFKPDSAVVIDAEDDDEQDDFDVDETPYHPDSTDDSVQMTDVELVKQELYELSKLYGVITMDWLEKACRNKHETFRSKASWKRFIESPAFLKAFHVNLENGHISAIDADDMVPF